MNTSTQNRLGVTLMAAAAAGLLVSMFIKEANSAGSAGSAGSAETAQAMRNAMKLEVSTGCKDGDATFRVRNLGSSWPKSSTFAIYRLGKGGRQMVSKRRMRLKDGQKASFRVKRSKNPTGRLALWVDPSWYKRQFDFDATVTCR